MRILKLSFLIVVSFLAVLPFIGLAYEYIGQYLEERPYTPTGTMVDVGGYEIHLQCKGTGSPPVVMDAGHGDSGYVWWRVIEEVSQFTTACAYDRPGNGWSDYSPRGRKIGVIAEELKRALQGAGVEGPYILMPHSIAGFYARVFADQYPEETAGIIFLDASHEGQWEFLGMDLKAAADAMDRAYLQALFGWRRLTGNVFALQNYNPEHTEMLKVLGQRPERFKTYGEIWQSLGGSGDKEIRAATNFGDLPLIVLTASTKGQLSMDEAEKKRRSDAWLGFQSRIAEMSTRSRHWMDPEATHYLQHSRLDVVVCAAETLVRELREERTIPIGQRLPLDCPDKSSL